MTNNKVLTKKDVTKALATYVFTRQIAQNYETMQSCGWVLSMHDCMEKIYPDKEVLAKKYKRHFQFFNCQPWMGTLIFGACLAIEEAKDPEATETAVNLRTGLMGPFAGLGDAIIFILPMTILGAIAGYSAIEGSAVGWLIAQTIGTVIWFAFWKLNYLAYEKGVQFVTKRQAQLNHLTEVASILGLTVVGALVASSVKLNVTFAYKVGEITQTVGSLLDSILPQFTAVAATFIIYKVLNIKGMSSGKLVWIIIGISILLAYFGICS